MGDKKGVLGYEKIMQEHLRTASLIGRTDAKGWFSSFILDRKLL